MNTNRKIRVLRIIGECKSGGTETIALNYYKNIDHDKISMDFLFYGDSLPYYKSELNKYGDSVINVSDYTKNLYKSINDISKVVKNGNYDIVHSQLNALNFFPLLGAYLGGAKIRIAANHSTANLKYELKKSLIKYILRPTSKILATHYAACSEYAGKWCFGEKNFKDGKIKVIRNAIDLDKFSYKDETRNKIRHNYNWEGHYVIGHVGRFTKQKNHEFLIDIFTDVHKKMPNAILVLIGDGYLTDSIKSKVHKYGLDDFVQFLGTCFNINELMQGMDIFVLPSLYEGLGNVITEAQAVGLRSVVSDAVPREVCMTDLVDYISLNSSSDKWAETILKYKDGYVRKHTQKELIENGYEIKTAADELIQYYSDLLYHNLKEGKKYYVKKSNKSTVS